MIKDVVLRPWMCFAFLISGIVLSANAQVDLKTMVPATPTTAALGKYGEIPISYHTGTANISVPLAELTGKDLRLPIELNYHSGGIKVEEMASWVGLGWSLFAGGVITREIRGLADDGQYGFLSNTTSNAEYPTGFTPTHHEYALLGAADFEADIYHFNLGAVSGSFIYDDAQDAFLPVEKNASKVFYRLQYNGWEIIGNDGTRYLFQTREQNTGSAVCGGTPDPKITTTGWYLTKIVNANKTDSIELEYENYAYQLTTLSEMTSHLIAEYFPGQEGCEEMGTELGSTTLQCYRTSQFAAKRLKEIRSRSGKVKFIIQATQRQDLPQDYALEYVEVYNNVNQLLWKHKFTYDYLVSPGTVAAENYRLRLKQVDRIAGATTEAYRKFEYSPYVLPGRLSYEQDYWGYYNGQSGNSVFYPSMVAMTGGGPLLVSGANRAPSNIEAVTHAGMLTKIIYPTNGYTAFEYEKHKVSNIQYKEGVYQAAFLDRGVNPGPVFTKTFTINEQPSNLNAYSSSGGAIVSFVVAGITCEYGQTTGQASTGCAVLSLSGPVGFHIIGNIQNRYLPNGTYTMTADFSSNVHGQASWEEFVIQASWNIAGSTPSALGGLRVRRTYDFDPVLNRVARKTVIKYYSELDTLISSAKWDSIPLFRRPIWYMKEVPCGGGIPCTEINWCKCEKISSNTNYPGLGGRGRITYDFVTVLEDNAGTQGKTTYRYYNPGYLVSTDYPFIPQVNLDQSRGMLLEQKKYVMKSGSQSLVQSVRNTYDVMPGSESKSIKIHPNLGGADVVFLQTLSINTIFSDGHWAVSEYNTRHNRLLYNDSTIVRTYGTESSIPYFQEVTTRLLDENTLNVVREVKTTSTGSTYVTRNKYASDYTLTGTNTSTLAVKNMKSRNMTGAVIESSTWHKATASDSVLVSASLSLPKMDGTRIVPLKVFKFPHFETFTPSAVAGGEVTYDSDYQAEVEVTKTDALGNITEAKATDGSYQSFVWDASGLNVLVTANNARQTDVFHISFEDNGSTHTDAQGQNLAKTGTKVLNAANYTFPGSYVPSSPANTVMTYWYWANSQWNFSGVVPYTTTITTSGTKIDEVRAYPKTAQLTTYAYLAGVGVSHVSDVNAETIRYEYDVFGRLVRVRDSKGNIVKAAEYHYRTTAQ